MMSTKADIQVLATAADLFQTAADEFVRRGRVAIGGQGRYTVALSGGSTPRGLYSLLGKNHADFPWARTHLFFGDERHVPPDHADSNFRMVNEALLTKISIPAENVHRVKAENPDAMQAAANYDSELRAFFELGKGDIPQFDLILLGLGPDGHTASLFPGSEALKEQSKLVVANWVEKFDSFRISFTYPVLNHCAEAIFLVSGADKAEIVSQILKGKHTPPYPAQLVNPSEGKLVWLLDAAAASNAR